MFLCSSLNMCLYIYGHLQLLDPHNSLPILRLQHRLGFCAFNAKDAIYENFCSADSMVYFNDLMLATSSNHTSIISTDLASLIAI